MRSTTRRGCFWTRRITCLSIGGLLFLGGYLTALWTPLPMAALIVPAQAAESHKGHEQEAQHHHKTHEVDLTPFMIRNAYHFASTITPRVPNAGSWQPIKPRNWRKI